MSNDKCWYLGACTNEDCSEHCIRYMEMKYMMDNSGIPSSRQKPSVLSGGVDTDAFRELKSIKDSIVDFVANGSNLYIASNYTGNGKTSWAIKLMLKYFDEMWAGNGFKPRAYFVHVPTFLARIKNFDDSSVKSYKEMLSTIDLVVWDDIASTNMSAFDYSQLLTLIDQRVLENKANIYTSNMPSLEDLEKCVGVKLTSRIYNNSKVVVFHGKDRRNGTVAIN